MLFFMPGCNTFNDADLEGLTSPNTPRKVIFFSNATGTRADNDTDRQPSEFLVGMIDSAQNTLEVCVYGFSKYDIFEAVTRAHYRGVKVRVVGDARHFGYGERGYRAMQSHRIPLQVGNEFHIMHNKFFVIDGRFTFVGTGNMTTTGFTKNHNNWILIDSPPVAKDFQDEFEQMFHGRFSNSKQRTDNGNVYKVGDTTVEVYFSPQEDTMGKMLEELDAAESSVHFQIFAFTKDQVGSRFTRLHRRFQELNALDGEDTKAVLDRKRKVVGVVDKSQIHGNGQYHEVYRLMSQGIPMRIDANANSYTPGDYQAGGGRLHTKTMIIDADDPEKARVVTGSFNWSSSATISNDEVLLVLRGERIVKAYMDVWQDLWTESLGLPDGLCSAYGENPYEGGVLRPTCGHQVKPGDVVFSEVHWDGWNGEPDPSDHTGMERDPTTNDEFLELYNTTDKDIDLSMWVISNGDDSVMGFTPGTIIRAKSYFLLLDHNTVPYSDTTPQRGTHAFRNPDFVLNTANDPRFPRLNLRNSSLRLELRAPRDYSSAHADTIKDALIDVVGDKSPPFFGGRVANRVFSMERAFNADGTVAGNGALRSSWKQCSATQGGRNVVFEYRTKVIATPGEANSN